MKKTNVVGWLVLACILAGSSQAAPLWEFKFNETGTIAANTGTSPTNMTTKQDFYGSVSDLHGAAGSGVSGLAGDRALDLSGINYTGGTFPGMSHTPYLDIPNASCAAIQNLQTLTLSGWFNSQSIISNTPAYGNNGTLIDFSSYQKGFGVQFNTDNSSTIKLCALVNAAKVYFDVSSVMAFNSTNKWFFWAVTYDGTLTASNLKLYMGTTNSSVTLVGTQSANQGTIVTEANDFGFNVASTGGGNTLKSFMDDIRIDSIVLAQSDLEARRKLDANIISAPTVDNASGATAVLTTSATLNGTLSAGTVANVYIYWWQDGSATTNLINFGAPLLQGAFATNLTGLAISTKYWYTCFASNSVGTAWAATATNFTTLAALRPTITNAVATNVLNTGACLNGYLTSTGTAPTYVWVGLDVVDRTTNKTWATFHSLGVQSVGSLTWKIPSGLTSNTWFWYTYYASNTVGDAWATTSMPFKTYGAPGVDAASGASPVGQTTATLNGTLTNGVSATVIILYGTNQTSWAFTNNIGTKSEGAFSLPVTGLLPATTYWYICYVTNPYGNALTTPTNFTTTPAYNYNDVQNGNFDNPATWSSSNGGTSYPQGVDTAVIDSNIVTQDLSNVSGTIYLNPNGMLRQNVYANAVQATLHLNGGLFWLVGGNSWRASTPVDVFVDADSTITNNDTANVDMQPIALHGTNRLTLYKPGGSLLALYLSSNSLFSGTFQLGAGATVELGNTNGAPFTEVPPAVANSAIDLHGVNAQIGTNNATLLTGGYNNLFYQAKVTGNGRIISAYHGYSGKWCIFTNGAVIAPGPVGTNAAGTIWLGFDRVVFATNSEYQCDIAGTNSADMLDCVNGDAVVTPVEIDPGAKLTVTFWTPTQAVTNLSVDILRTTSFVAGTNLFAVTFKNTNRWSNVAVNYDTNSLPMRVYVTASAYTPPSAAGTVFYIR